VLTTEGELEKKVFSLSQNNLTNDAVKTLSSSVQSIRQIHIRYINHRRKTAPNNRKRVK